MPFRDDLLTPISGEAPGGADLSYDKVFDQIKEARVEDDDSLPAGTWVRTAKRADRQLVVQLAGEALATRSKDLRLAGWYGESLLRHEGFVPLTPLLEMVHQLQNEFWEVLHPLQDDDGDLGRRIGALEALSTLWAAQLKQLPLSRRGLSFLQAQDARVVGYEQDATTQAKKDLRADAVARGRIMAEELDRAVLDTPKAFYGETDLTLRSAKAALDTLDGFQEERYGDDPPSFVRLKSAIADVHILVGSILLEKRKTEPDPEPVTAVPEPAAQVDVESKPVTTGLPSAVVTPNRPKPAEVAGVNLVVKHAIATEPDSKAEALAQVAEAVRFLGRSEASLDAAYLLAAAPGVALAWRAEADQTWPAPVPGTRQALRLLARSKSWTALERTGLDTLVTQPETVWLDLHRYIWQAAAELGHRTLAAAVIATVCSCLAQAPGLDKALLDDDTPTAGAETQHWLAALRAEMPNGTLAEAGQLSATVASALGVGGANGHPGSSFAMDPLAEAMQLLKAGRDGEAIGLLSRFAEEQPSGRLRFERRLQTAELCLQAGHAAVAQPLLADLTAELERRTLEGWESANLLGKPLELLIRCLDAGVHSSDNRATLFARLCRLDPMAAAALDRREGGGTG